MSWNRQRWGQQLQQFNPKHTAMPPGGWYAGMGRAAAWNKQQRSLDNYINNKVNQALAQQRSTPQGKPEEDQVIWTCASCHTTHNNPHKL
eukprot:2936636-Karenia_brevis.AAC.1